MGQANLACNRDSDCTHGLAARCSVVGPGPPKVTCSYDDCASDSDCAKGVPCQCRAAGSSDADTCLTQSTCGVDADCGPNGLLLAEPTWNRIAISFRLEAGNYQPLAALKAHG